MTTKLRTLTGAALIAVALAFIAGSAGNAQRLATALPAPVIASLPAGIMNPADICNGWYPDVCPVPFEDRGFQDQLGWVLDEMAEAGVSGLNTTFTALRNTCGPGDGDGCLPYTPTLITISRADATFTTGAREVLRGVEAVRIGALQAFGVDKSKIALKWYPGYESRHPSQGNPVGEPWPDHPYTRMGWKMFRPSAADALDKFPVGAIFQLDQRRWRKWRSVVKPGAGPFGSGGLVADAWEETTLR